MSKLNEFIATVKNGLQQSHNFDVQFLTNIGGDNRQLSLLCDEVTVPGMTLASNTVFTFGESREVVYNRTFEPANFTFMVDINSNVMNFFRNWMDNIIDPKTRLTKYYDTYATPSKVVIQHLNAEKQPVYSVTLHEAFPKSLNSYTLSNAGKDVLRYSVTMNYKYWDKSNLVTAPVTSPRITQSINGGTPR
jgi:hypothetical protein